MGEVLQLPVRPRVAPQSAATVHLHMLRVLLAGFEVGDVDTAIKIMAVSTHLYAATVGSEARAAEDLAVIAKSLAALSGGSVA